IFRRRANGGGRVLRAKSPKAPSASTPGSATSGVDEAAGIGERSTSLRGFRPVEEGVLMTGDAKSPGEETFAVPTAG
ncbi:MAG: hypothetical protein O3A18_14085, partial [Planctomycetota bacterium]|nr:hypothetical protein [Planctomycetota bacterium]